MLVKGRSAGARTARGKGGLGRNRTGLDLEGQGVEAPGVRNRLVELCTASRQLKGDRGGFAKLTGLEHGRGFFRVESGGRVPLDEPALGDLVLGLVGRGTHVGGDGPLLLLLRAGRSRATAAAEAVLP